MIAEDVKEIVYREIKSRFSGGVAIEPQYSSKGELQSAVKIWVSGNFDRRHDLEEFIVGMADMIAELVKKKMEEFRR